MAIDLSRFLDRFVVESREHLQTLAEGVIGLRIGQPDPDKINHLFRAAHTLKGSSRMLKLLPLTETSHLLEDVLAAMRDGALRVDERTRSALIAGVDALSDLVDVLAEQLDPAVLPEADRTVCAALEQLLAAGPAGVTAATEVMETPTEGRLVGLDAHLAAPDRPDAEAQASSPRLRGGDTVRLPLERLDRLIKMMGEVANSHERMRVHSEQLRKLGHALHVLTQAEGRDRTLCESLIGLARTMRSDIQSQAVLIASLNDAALTMRMLPLSIVFDPITRTVRDFARSIGKEVDIEVSGAGLEMDRQIIDKLADPLVHLMRNAVDHGVESSQHRTESGKPERAKIELVARQESGKAVIEVSDDGAGIAWERVREKVVKKGWMTDAEAQALHERELMDWIFRPGFSTAPIITDVSGRGVGLDVVRQVLIEDLSGDIHVDSRAGAGCRFVLTLPLSLALARVLLISSRGHVFAFATLHVSELLSVPAGALLEVADRRAVIVRNEFVPVVALDDLLGLRDGLPPRVEPVCLVVLRIGSDKVAVIVDEWLDERDMMIKSLPDHLCSNALAGGVVETAQGDLAVVLHVPALMQAARGVQGRRSADQPTTQSPDAHRPRVLVVDDSLNTRELEKDVLEAHGYQVTLAEDGMDGLSRALADEFDAILTDVEMPRMDGFTLTARLRESERYRHRPIVIITSREREADKRRGLQAGADAYIVKGDFDQNSLVDTLQALLGS